MTKSFTSLLIRLAKEGVDFVIIGGFAGVVHGSTVLTQDIDICCDFTIDNLMRIQAAVSDLHPTHRMASKKIALNLTSENCKDYKNLYLDTDMGQLDCLGFVAGIGDFKAVEEVSQAIEVEGTKLKVLRIESLIDSKKAMNRPHDKEAVVQLEVIQKIKQTKSDQ